MMRLESGDQWPSSCGTGALGKSCVSSVPSMLTVQSDNLPPKLPRVKRNFLPSGDHCRCWRKPEILTRRVGLAAGGWATEAWLTKKISHGRTQKNTEKGQKLR